MIERDNFLGLLAQLSLITEMTLGQAQFVQYVLYRSFRKIDS